MSKLSGCHFARSLNARRKCMRARERFHEYRASYHLGGGGRGRGKGAGIHVARETPTTLDTLYTRYIYLHLDTHYKSYNLAITPLIDRSADSANPGYRATISSKHSSIHRHLTILTHVRRSFILRRSPAAAPVLLSSTKTCVTESSISSFSVPDMKRNLNLAGHDRFSKNPITSLNAE